MKNTNGLQIGNWVETGKYGAAQIKEIREKTIFLDFHNSPEIKIKAIDPIEITENWLLKFGFKKINRHNDKDCWGYTIKGIMYILQTLDKFYINNANDNDILFVHQLQNYMEVCGENIALSD